jgi:hypothetical protein
MTLYYITILRKYKDAQPEKTSPDHQETKKASLVEKLRLLTRAALNPAIVTGYLKPLRFVP